MRRHRAILFVAFAFTVMADPVSSVAYAMQAALVSLESDLSGLFAAMAAVIAVIALVAAGYHQLIGRFPRGGGGAEALAAAFGEGWAFVPVGALLVDFTLTIAVSTAAAGSALIAAAPGLADDRVPLAIALAAVVAAVALLGHRGRIAFASAALAFVALALVVLEQAIGAEPVAAAAAAPLLSGVPLGASLLAVPLAMALATGVEAPSNAIAQLDVLDDAARVRFGRGTLWTMLAVVAVLTLGFAAAAATLGVGLPPRDSTMLAEIARAATGGGWLFDAFQAASALLLLAAAASAYLAGSGLLRALARHARGGELIPAAFGRGNRYAVPALGIGVLLGTSAVLIGISGGREQELVVFYAVAVFASFFAALAGAARLALAERRRGALAIDLVALAAVAGILALNIARLEPLASLAVSAAISGLLWRRWHRAGRPAGVARVVS